MKRLQKTNYNTPEHFDEIFQKKLNYREQERWEKLVKYFTGGKFLDIGCLDSPLCVELNKKYPESEFWGLDYAPEVIKWLKQSFPYINYICADCMKMPFEDNYFDYIVAGELIEHLDNPERFIEEAIRILKPKGWLVLSTPLEEGKKSLVDRKYHVWSFTSDDIENMLKKYGDVQIDWLIESPNSKFIIAYLYASKI